jgi:hypothetical protein
MNKAEIKFDAHVKKDGSIVLTNDLHQKGEMVLLKRIDITSEPWMMEAVVSMTDNIGISDEDGKGGDGIWFKFNDENLVIGLDTFMNESNKSGNEIVIKSEGEIISQQACPIRLNNGKKLNLKVICKPSKPSMIAVVVNNKPVISYVYKSIPITQIFQDKPVKFSIYSFTGDAGSTQTVHSVRFKTLDKKVFDQIEKEIKG